MLIFGGKEEILFWGFLCYFFEELPLPLDDEELDEDDELDDEELLDEYYLFLFSRDLLLY